MKKFMSLVERCVRDTVQDCYPRHWEENHITHTLLHKLTRKTQFTLIYRGAQLSVVWDAFFIKQNLQRDNGDILVYVRIRDVDEGRDLDGIGIIEAKRRYDQGYDSIVAQQFQHILESHPYAQLLLYNFETANLGRASERPSYAATMPMQVANDLKSRVAKLLHGHAATLAHQLGLRYFFGCDLEISDERQGLLADTLRAYGVPYCLRISVNVDRNGTASPQRLPRPQPPALPQDVVFKPVTKMVPEIAPAEVEPEEIHTVGLERQRLAGFSGKMQQHIDQQLKYAQVVQKKG